jgi:dienelactone hydrolase
LHGEKPGDLSFRNPRWSGPEEWRKEARAAFIEHLHLPPDAHAADVKVHARRSFQDLEVEELSWQLPYGPRTEAYFLKPKGATGKLPGFLALHDHGGNKYFGKRKIVRIGSPQHPMMDAHQADCYGGAGWACEMARRGFAVLVHDGFGFESRKILASDLPAFVVDRLMSPPESVRELTPQDVVSNTSRTDLDVPPDEPVDRIQRYNAFAGQHESVVAKSLFAAGLTWPGVTVADDKAALDYLGSRPDVDARRLGCGGLSGGGLRTVLLAGLDDRIRAAICAGFMSTWRDFVLTISFTHTWMAYVPGMPALMDFPEILGLRAPLPTCVFATSEDPLYSLGETKRAVGILEEIYRKAAAPERFMARIHPGPHKFDLPMQAEAFTWVEKWIGER